MVFIWWMALLGMLKGAAGAVGGAVGGAAGAVGGAAGSVGRAVAQGATAVAGKAAAGGIGGALAKGGSQGGFSAGGLIQKAGEAIPGKTGELISQGGKMFSTLEALPRGGPLETEEQHKLGEVQLSSDQSGPDISPLRNDLRPSLDLEMVNQPRRTVELSKPMLEETPLSRLQTRYPSRLMLEAELLEDLRRRRWRN